MNTEVLQQDHWDEQYDDGGLPWDIGRRCPELQTVLKEYGIEPCRAVEFGCGTGSDAVYLASQGFDVTAVDLSQVAIREAERRAEEAGVTVQFLVGDMTDPDLFSRRFDFIYDRGCYHAVRLADGRRYLETVQKVTRPRALGLVLLGNAREPEDEVGPPVLDEAEVRSEWGRMFEIVHLRSFRFEPRRPGEKRYLGWSCLVRRKPLPNERSGRSVG